ncbi:GTPase [Aestuariimicrobium ganziense]|uniref:GTPase n=1 Tax=Aestuariimicrobium ganziense TaxID=2773677 RepID=UPI0019429587|nr:GTPase [Aestuariimicrobium ganziense]
MARRRPLPERVAALGEAAELSRGRLDDDLVDRVSTVVGRVDQRLAFSGDHTVVALAGSTGSGKSSLFNALSGTELAEPGIRRPTTSRAMAAAWGEAPSELLDWLEVPRRHVVEATSSAQQGLVLLDLPDHDSTEASHRMEVDRLVQLVDLLIWVVDPQKYADAALHDRYLRPLADHAEVTMVVLNQIDRLTPEQVKACVADLRRLLDAEGLSKTSIVAVSAMTGQGVVELRKQLLERVKSKTTAAERLGADVTTLAAQMRDAVAGSGGEVSAASRRQLTSALARAASTEVVVEAVLGATRRRGTLATGWPALSWIASLRPDPLRRLHLSALPVGKGRKALEPSRVQRSALPSGQGVPRARVDSAVRTLADEASQNLPAGWADAVRAASRRNESVLPDELDRAVSTTDLAMDRGLGWWKIFQVLQWILITAVVLGLLWLGVDVALAYFQLPALPVYRWRGVPYQTWAVIGGVVAGLLLAAVSRVFVEVAARGKARRAESVLHRSVAEVGDRLVVEPVEQELSRFRGAVEAIERAA